MLNNILNRNLKELRRIENKKESLISNCKTHLKSKSNGNLKSKFNGDLSNFEGNLNQNVKET